VQNLDSGGPSEEDFEEFLNDQTDLTLVAVALFKNPVNIWIPSCISKIHKTRIKTLLVTSSETGSYYAKECGIINEGDENEEIDAKEFYEKAQNNRFWLEHHIHHIRVVSRASALHKYYLTDCLLNLNEETMVVSNKQDDLSSVRRAQIGISSQEIDNSSLFEDSSIVLSKRGFLEVYNLFKYAYFLEQCTKESYVYCISSILSMVFLSLIFAVAKGDTLFEPVHFIIMLIIEMLVHEFLFKTIVDTDNVYGEQTDSDDMIKGYSLDEKSRKIMRYHIIYTVAVPSSVFIFNLIPSGFNYYMTSESLADRVENGIPSLNSFLFIFLIISRVCSVLNLRCKNVSSWISVAKKPQFLVLLSIISMVIILPYVITPVGAIVQVRPLSIFRLLFCLMLSTGTLVVQLFTSGLSVLQDSQGLNKNRHHSMRETTRLDFTADFD